MFDPTYPGRRQFLGATATTFAAASLGLIPSARAGVRPAQPAAASPSKQRSNPSLGPVKQILRGIGHNVPREAPEAFTQAVIDADGYAG